ncbi:hypothetical protein D3C78_1968020 [compost metagenome]
MLNNAIASDTQPLANKWKRHQQCLNFFDAQQFGVVRGVIVDIVRFRLTFDDKLVVV